MASKDSEIKTVVVASDDSSITKEEQVEKDSGTKNVVVVASDDSGSGKEEVVEKDAEIKNVVVASDDSKLLVLPIGGFLVHRAHRRRPSTIPKRRRPDFSSGNFMIYKRPYCEGFLKFCFERFEVGIWSSAMEHNIGGVLDNVMGEFKSKLLFTWDQNQCTKTDFMCLDNKNKPVFLKELDHIWKKKYSYLPWCDGDYSSTDTLLITDPVKALLNPPNTAISLGSYDPENKEDDLLGPNGELRVFLEGLAEAEDVQTYVKDHPIGEPLITPSHADWDYYSKIIRAYGKNK
ncbi:hypothetical protein L1987_00191 [Smallanthus sonchifolius]|uniref:Uncharacterized protein n=1 Tax=Smallanthus sonchifolius TaxID=185202 RepID=A0ACB9K1J3_9ASTR|nr:hypothetical protein L1987_00191 [Smallanthus sonchifolius]